MITDKTNSPSGSRICL